KPNFPANWHPSVQNVMPQLQHLVPSAAPLRGVAGQPSPTFWNDLNMALQKGNMDQAVGMAAAAPPDYRYSAFQNVAMNVASSTGNLDAAREILNRSDIPEGQREQMIEQLAHQAAVGDAARGATAQARAAADLIRYTTDRAQAYIQIAQAALGRKDKATAAAFLNDAAAMLPSPPADAADVNALGSLASAYLQIDPARSAEILSGLIDVANEKFPALAVVDGFLFNGMRSFYNGEMVMQYGGGVPLLSAVSSALYSLAATDSDRAMALAARLQRPEAKVTAYLGIARALLGSGVGPGYGSSRSGGIAGYGSGSGFITISH